MRLVMRLVMRKLQFPLLGFRGHRGQRHVARVSALTMLSPYSDLATSSLLFPLAFLARSTSCLLTLLPCDTGHHHHQ